MPRVVHTVAEWCALRAEHRAAGRSVGFVPTMGALHTGHTSLMQAARRECAVVLVSLFVNPTQFDEPHDFEKYPRTLGADVALMEAAGVDVVFTPSVAEMYPNGTRYSVVENELSGELCGAHLVGPRADGDGLHLREVGLAGCAHLGITGPAVRVADFR